MNKKLRLLGSIIFVLMTLSVTCLADNILHFPNNGTPQESDFDTFLRYATGTFKSRDGVVLTVEYAPEEGTLKALALRPDIDVAYTPEFFNIDLNFEETQARSQKFTPYVNALETVEYDLNLPLSLIRIKTTTSTLSKVVEEVRISFSNLGHLNHSYSKTHYVRRFKFIGLWLLSPSGKVQSKLTETSYIRKETAPIDLEALAKLRAKQRQLLTGWIPRNTPLDGWGSVVPVDFSQKTLTCKSLL